MGYRLERLFYVIRQKILALSFSLFLVTIILELSIRAISSGYIYNYDVEMHRYGLLLKEKAPEKEVVKHKKNKSEILMGTEVSTDCQGNRVIIKNELSDIKPLKTLMFLGDSITLGWGVEASKTFSGLAAMELGSRIQVINAGVGNTNTEMEVARLRRFCLSGFIPNYLFLVWFINDAEPSYEYRSPKWYEYSVISSLWTGWLKRLVNPLKQDYFSYYKSLYNEDKKGFQNMRRAIYDLAQLCEENKIMAEIFLIPEMHEIHHFGRFKNEYKKASKIFNDAGFQTIPGDTFFEQGDYEKYFVTPSDAHPNALANRLLFKALQNSSIYKKILNN